MTITWEQVLAFLCEDQTMAITSLLFLAFFAAVALINYALPRVLRPYFLLAASYGFFCYDPVNRPLVWVIAAATVLTWLCGLIIGKVRAKPVRVLARLRSIPDYVPVESDAQVLIDYDNGAAGIFWTSFAMVGKSCCMKVRIYGDKGGMEWNAHDFMELRVDIAGQPTQIWSANYDYCDPQARKSCRLPKGMPEAFHSLFANFYRGYCSHLLSRKEGKDERPFPYSDIDDGIQGLKFIEACLKSQEDGNVWTQV